MVLEVVDGSTVIVVATFTVALVILVLKLLEGCVLASVNSLQ